jgi:hypothetical protein
MNIRRAISGALLFGMIAGGTAIPTTTQAAGDDTAAIIMSLLYPGAGEWYNSGFSGGFPLVECILGTICPCVRISTVIDAAAGRTDDAIRFDFWGSPN